MGEEFPLEKRGAMGRRGMEKRENERTAVSDCGKVEWSERLGGRKSRRHRGATEERGVITLLVKSKGEKLGAKGIEEVGRGEEDVNSL